MCPFVYVIQYCIDSEYRPVLNVWIIFFTYLIDLDGLSVAKSSYGNELSVAQTANGPSVAKLWDHGWSVVKDEVRRYIYLTTASIATAGVCRYNF